MKIPDIDKKFSISNKSDLLGNIWYTKNMNFDEEGYIRLSSRALNVIDERDDINMGIPVSFGRFFLNDYYNYVVTVDKPFLALTSPTGGFTGSADAGTNHPTLSFKSYGKWWRNLWHVTGQSGGLDTKLWYKDPSTGNWTDSGVTLTTGILHPLAVFRSKPLSAGQLCIGNGNTVLVVDNTYATIITLTLPTDYEVIGLSYNNQRLGIICRLSTNAQGQNQEAYFFSWDGATSAANIGIPVRCDGVVGIVPYQSSWAILNTVGELLYWNGGGFDKLGQLPFYHNGYYWGNSYNQEALGDCMKVEGDLIFLNVNHRFNQFGKKYEQSVQNMPGGIWCYDPKVGLYHRYSPSITKGSFLNVPTANVDISLDTLTASSGTVPTTGNPVKYLWIPGTVIGGLQTGVVYYIIKITSTKFKLALTKADAIAGIAIDLTSVGGTNNYFLALTLLDYGATRMDRTGAVELMGQETYAFDHLIFGGEYVRYDSTNDYSAVCVTIGGFPNRGFVVTTRISSPNITDISRKLFIKYKPLKDIDSIIAKYKDTEVEGLPVTTPQVGIGATWSTDKIFTTTTDISEAYNYLNADSDNELECEIIGGAGAGQMAQIASISYVAGTYTVTLAESLDGITNGYLCDIIIDNWKLLKTENGDSSITSEDTNGYMQFPVVSQSKWIKYKIETRGIDVTLEEIIPINTPQVLPE